MGVPHLSVILGINEEFGFWKIVPNLVSGFVKKNL